MHTTIVKFISNGFLRWGHWFLSTKSETHCAFIRAYLSERAQRVQKNPVRTRFLGFKAILFLKVYSIWPQSYLNIANAGLACLIYLVAVLNHNIGSFNIESLPKSALGGTLRYLLKEHAHLTIYEQFSTLLPNFNVINKKNHPALVIQFWKKFHPVRWIDPTLGCQERVGWKKCK